MQSSVWAAAMHERLKVLLEGRDPGFEASIHEHHSKQWADEKPGSRLMRTLHGRIAHLEHGLPRLHVNSLVTKDFYLEMHFDPGSVAYILAAIFHQLCPNPDFTKGHGVNPCQTKRVVSQHNQLQHAIEAMFEGMLEFLADRHTRIVRTFASPLLALVDDRQFDLTARHVIRRNIPLQRRIICDVTFSGMKPLCTTSDVDFGDKSKNQKALAKDKSTADWMPIGPECVENVNEGVCCRSDDPFMAKYIVYRWQEIAQELIWVKLIDEPGEEMFDSLLCKDFDALDAHDSANRKRGAAEVFGVFNQLLSTLENGLLYGNRQHLETHYHASDVIAQRLQRLDARIDSLNQHGKSGVAVHIPEALLREIVAKCLSVDLARVERNKWKELLAVVYKFGYRATPTLRERLDARLHNDRGVHQGDVLDPFRPINHPTSCWDPEIASHACKGTKCGLWRKAQGGAAKEGRVLAKLSLSDHLQQKMPTAAKDDADCSDKDDAGLDWKHAEATAELISFLLPIWDPEQRRDVARFLLHDRDMVTSVYEDTVSMAGRGSSDRAKQYKGHGEDDCAGCSDLEKRFQHRIALISNLGPYTGPLFEGPKDFFNDFANFERTFNKRVRQMSFCAILFSTLIICAFMIPWLKRCGRIDEQRALTLFLPSSNFLVVMGRKALSLPHPCKGNRIHALIVPDEQDLTLMLDKHLAVKSGLPKGSNTLKTADGTPLEHGCFIVKVENDDRDGMVKLQAGGSTTTLRVEGGKQIWFSTSMPKHFWSVTNKNDLDCFVVIKAASRTALTMGLGLYFTIGKEYLRMRMTLGIAGAAIVQAGLYSFTRLLDERDESEMVLYKLMGEKHDDIRKMHNDDQTSDFYSDDQRERNEDPVDRTPPWARGGAKPPPCYGYFLTSMVLCLLYGQLGCYLQLMGNCHTLLSSVHSFHCVMDYPGWAVCVETLYVVTLTWWAMDILEPLNVMYMYLVIRLVYMRKFLFRYPHDTLVERTIEIRQDQIEKLMKCCEDDMQVCQADPSIGLEMEDVGKYVKGIFSFGVSAGNTCDVWYGLQIRGCPPVFGVWYDAKIVEVDLDSRPPRCVVEFAPDRVDQQPVREEIRGLRNIRKRIRIDPKPDGVTWSKQELRDDMRWIQVEERSKFADGELPSTSVLNCSLRLRLVDVATEKLSDDVINTEFADEAATAIDAKGWSADLEPQMGRQYRRQQTDDTPHSRGTGMDTPKSPSKHARRFSALTKQSKQSTGSEFGETVVAANHESVQWWLEERRLLIAQAEEGWLRTRGVVPVLMAVAALAVIGYCLSPKIEAQALGFDSMSPRVVMQLMATDARGEMHVLTLFAVIVLVVIPVLMLLIVGACVNSAVDRHWRIFRGYLSMLDLNDVRRDVLLNVFLSDSGNEYEYVRLLNLAIQPAHVKALAGVLFTFVLVPYISSQTNDTVNGNEMDEVRAANAKFH